MDTGGGLRGYVPDFALGDQAVTPACLLFADVSGYTRLSERLSVIGRGGAEIVTDVVNRCFTELIDVVLDHGGDVIRFGGDALFIAFGGDDRVARAASAAALMQRRLRAIPAVAVPGGRVKLRMSVGIEDGDLVAFDWSSSPDGAPTAGAPTADRSSEPWGERLPIGAAVTTTLRLEAAATSGQVRVGPRAAEVLGSALVDGGLLRLQAAGRRAAAGVPDRRPGDVGVHRIPPALRDLLAVGAPPEHRAVSIGFVKLSGTDAAAGGDAAARDRLRRLLDAVDVAAARYAIVPIGTDVDVDGVKVIVASGVPTATEDDEERLLRALLDIVTTEPTARAGATAGLAFVGDVGHPDRRAFTAMGDTVNLAARLMAAAAPGTVLGSDRLLHAAPDRFELAWLPPFSVKGKAALQHAASVRGEIERRAGAGSRPEFRGRRHESSAIDAALRSTGVVEVVGVPGIGASRLVDETMSVDRGARQVVGRRTVWIHATVADRGEPLGVVARVPWFEAPTTDVGATSSITATADLLLERWPDDTVLVVDGAQHADDPSIGVLRAVAFAIEPTGRGLVVIGRERRLGAAHRCVAVPALDDDDVAALIVDVAPRALSDADLDALVARANGNPRFAIGLAQLTSVDDDLPPSIEALVAADIDRIPREMRTILREAATAGTECTIDDLVDLCERSEPQVRSAVALGRHLVTIDATDTVRFADDTSREVLAGGLPVQRRRRLHRRRLAMLARRDAVAPAQLAYHAIQSGDHASIVRWCEAAASAAMHGGASAAAARLARHGLDAAQRSIGDSGPAGRATVVRIARLLADACRAAGLADGERDALAVASRFETDGRRRTDIDVRRSSVARQQLRLASARSLLAMCSRTADDESDARRTIDLEWARLAWYEGRSDVAVRRLDDLARRAIDAGDHRVGALALALLEQILASSGSERARATGDAALAAALASGDETLISMVYGNLALSADNRGEWGVALDWYERAAEVALRTGDVVTMARLADNRATIQVELGDVDPLVALLAQTGRVEAAAGLDDATAVNRCLAARVGLRRGGLDRATTETLVNRSRQAIEILGELPDDEVGDFQRCATVEIDLLAGDAEQARSAAALLRSRFDAYGPDHLLPITVRRLEAMATAALGDDDGALLLAEEAIDLADRAGIRVEQCLTRLVRWQIAGPRTADERRRTEDLQREIGLVSAVRIPRRVASPTG